MTEDTLFEQLFTRLGALPDDVAVGPGDDCAAVRGADGRLWLLAVDQIVGGRHYLDAGPSAASPEEVGRKLLARNLSDVAAMGGEPRFALVAVARSPGQDEEWLLRFYDGIVQSARRYGVVMIGGDLASTNHDAVAALAIVGVVEEDCICLRSGAAPGDVLYATGTFGGSLPTGWHLRFEPRCREGRWLAVKGFARAMIDVSDGFLLDALRMCRASDVGLEVDTKRIPLRLPDLDLRRALTDGEDYELLVAVPEGAASRLEAEWPFADVPITRLGRFTTFSGKRDAERVRDFVGRVLTDVVGGVPGYDHLRKQICGGADGADTP